MSKSFILTPIKPALKTTVKYQQRKLTQADHQQHWAHVLQVWPVFQHSPPVAQQEKRGEINKKAHKQQQFATSGVFMVQFSI